MQFPGNGFAVIDFETTGFAAMKSDRVVEIGVVCAVLASVFSAAGSYLSPQTFVDGMVPAIWVGATAVAIAGVAAVAIPPRQDVVPDSVLLLERGDGEHTDRRPAGEPACEADAAA